MTRAACMVAHPAGVLTDAGIEARRRALQLEEEGLAYLVPVDRIIAAVGGVVGGVLVLAGAVAVAAAKDAAGVRRARATYPDRMTEHR